MLSKTSLARTYRRIAVTLALLLPFLVFFDAPRNIDMQGYLVVVVGVAAWLAIALQAGRYRLERPTNILLAIFGLSLLLSTFFRPHLGYNLLGAPFARLGLLQLLSCIGFGIMAAGFKRDLIIRAVFYESLAVAVVALPYDLLKYHEIGRIGGLFAQADIMACFTGVGIMAGLYTLGSRRHRARSIILAELYLSLILFLTQTRAVLAIVLFFVTVWLVRLVPRNDLWKGVAAGALACAVIFALLPILPGRVSDSHYARFSALYRVDLQSAGFKALAGSPYLGYGPGNLADALDCRKLTSEPLQQTCHDKYFFNSSHDIFLDRALQTGLLGGLAFLGLALGAIRQGWASDITGRYTSLMLLVICGYYLTNVTGPTLELLLWTVMFACLGRTARS